MKTIENEIFNFFEYYYSLNHEIPELSWDEAIPIKIIQTPDFNKIIQLTFNKDLNYFNIQFCFQYSSIRINSDDNRKSFFDIESKTVFHRNIPEENIFLEYVNTMFPRAIKLSQIKSLCETALEKKWILEIDKKIALHKQKNDYSLFFHIIVAVKVILIFKNCSKK